MVGSVEDTTKEDIHKLFDLNLVGYNTNDFCCDALYAGKTFWKNN